jgi:threonine/homoserine/homoserine lactone efflux protein
MARALALGFLVGLPIAASPGPIFFLVLRRTLARGWPSGLTAGLGVATGDAAYAALAAFGVSVVTNFLLAPRRWIGLAGGIAIMLIGLRTLGGKGPNPDPPPEGEGKAEQSRPAGEGNSKHHVITSYGSMVALTLSNPPTILSFMAVVAGLGVHVGSGWQSAVGLVLGVMLGSLLWWVLLTVVVSVVRERLTPTVPAESASPPASRSSPSAS